MTDIPLILELKKSRHKDVALAQDLIIEELFKIFDNAILHGGTSIWRCYKGNRFSEDIDVYIPRNIEKIDSLFNSLTKKGFKIVKKKVSKNSLYSELELNRTRVRFEAIFKSLKGKLVEYETIEGNLLAIYSLSPEQIINEKVETYLKRLEIRDLYDIFFLIRYVKEEKEIKEKIAKLIRNYKNPIDEKELKILIIKGLTPKTEDMLIYIKDFLKWEKKNIKRI